MRIIGFTRTPAPPPVSGPQCCGECEGSGCWQGKCAGSNKDAFRDGYGCTRDVGHSGPHVACASDAHDLCVWSK